MTDAEFSEWAQSSTKYPILLVEITHKVGTVYLSDHIYATGTGETPAHVSYDVCLKDTVLVERTLDADSLGAIRVYNDGSLDNWLDLLFVGYQIEILIGDKSWPRADFKRQFLGTVDSFEQLSATSYEIKSTLATSVAVTQIYNANNIFFGGVHTNTRAVYAGSTFGLKRFRVANVGDFDPNDVLVYYNNSTTPTPHSWISDQYLQNTFYLDNYNSADHTLVTFSCTSLADQKFKSLFVKICTYVGQQFNADNLAAYPIDPDITFYITLSMTFDEFLDLTLQTIGAMKWINDAGEIEFYRKLDPDQVTQENIISFITTNDSPIIKTVTTEPPAASVVSKNPDYNHLAGGGPNHYEYNVVDLAAPYRTLLTYSYAEDSYAIAEARRMADLLSVTRRTYSVTLNRICPELYIGAVVNIYSPKDRWNNSNEGLNALVVGISQSFTKNTSELIVWR